MLYVMLLILIIAVIVCYFLCSNVEIKQTICDEDCANCDEWWCEEKNKGGNE